MFNLYENIKRLCEERGITVGKMSDETGISRSLLSNLKNGRSATISGATAEKIAEYLNVTVDDVQHGQKEKPSEDGELAQYPEDLGYHLGISERQLMQLGGWSDYHTMHKIYIRVSESSGKAAENRIAEFFRENAN